MCFAPKSAASLTTSPVSLPIFGSAGNLYAVRGVQPENPLNTKEISESCMAIVGVAPNLRVVFSCPCLKKRGHWQFGIQKVEQVGLLSRHDVLLPLNTQFKAGVREPVNSLPMTLAG